MQTIVFEIIYVYFVVQEISSIIKNFIVSLKDYSQENDKSSNLIFNELLFSDIIIIS